MARADGLFGACSTSRLIMALAAATWGDGTTVAERRMGLVEAATGGRT